MKIYLLRHGDATGFSSDCVLTDKGIEQVQVLFEHLKDNLSSISEIWHSPYIRAKQTAEIVLKVLNNSAEIIKRPDLEPDRDCSIIVNKLVRCKKDVLLVGHNPYLEQLTTLLLTGKSNHSIIDLKKSGLACVERGGEGFSYKLKYYLTPDIIN